MNSTMNLSENNEIVLCAWNVFIDDDKETPETISRHLKEVKDAGFNSIGILWTSNDYIEDLILKELLYNDLNLIVKSPPKIFNDGTKELTSSMKKLKNFKGFLGFMLSDEPSADNFDELSKTKRIFDSFFAPEKFMVCNLYPNYASPEQLGVAASKIVEDPMQLESGIDISAYEKHIGMYLEIFKPEFLCYDNYFITKSIRSSMPGSGKYIYRYISNLCSISKAARKAQIPFYNVIQAWAYNDDLLSPTIPEYRWMMNTSVVFGARGIISFSYRNLYHEEGGPEKWKDCPITMSGEKTETYEVIRQCNKEFLTFTDAYKDFHLAGLMLYNCDRYIANAIDEELLIDGFLPIHSIAGSGGALIGCMTNNDTKGIFIVNSSFYERADLEIFFNDRVSTEIRDKDGKHERMFSDKICIGFDKGESKFICLYC